MDVNLKSLLKQEKSQNWQESFLKEIPCWLNSNLKKIKKFKNIIQNSKLAQWLDVWFCFWKNLSVDSFLYNLANFDKLLCLVSCQEKDKKESTERFFQKVKENSKFKKTDIFLENLEQNPNNNIFHPADIIDELQNLRLYKCKK